MNPITPTINSAFAHYICDFRNRVHALSSQLSEEQFWMKPHSYGNSFGNLVLHLAGNLNYYIGTQVEQSGYIRNREAEFAEVAGVSKSEALKGLDEAVEMVLGSVQRQTEADWTSKYEAVGVDDVHDRFSIFLRCSVHFHHHIGQMIYLVKAWQSQR